MKLSDFMNCKTPQDFIDVAGGDLRLAETAAWALWEDSGPVGKRVQALSYIAQAIAEQKFLPDGRADWPEAPSAV